MAKTAKKPAKKTANKKSTAKSKKKSTKKVAKKPSAKSSAKAIKKTAKKVVKKPSAKSSAKATKKSAKKTTKTRSKKSSPKPTKNLVIVESPSKASTIEKYLGKDYKVVATVGHVIDLPKSKLAVDVENDYEPNFSTIKGKASVIRSIKKQVPDPKDGEVFLAMDPDREGEAIAWHISNALKLDDPQRIVFHEITEQAVEEAMAKPRDLDEDLVEAQVARRVLDRLVGYKVSELIWKKIWYGLSAGRVQSVALKLIVERELEIESFVPVEYWELDALSEHPKDGEFKARLAKVDTKKVVVGEKKEFTDIKKDLSKKDLLVKDIKTRKVSKNPYPPFTTSTLQQAANNVLGFSAKRTMGVAQALYQAGYITYMRTDSVHLSDQAVDQIRGVIESKYGKEYLPDERKHYKVKSKAAQEAHEAIRPSDFSKSRTSIKTEMGDAYSKLYSLIYDRAVSSQMKNRESEIMTIIFESIGASKKVYEFKLGAEKVLFDGFRAALGTSGKGNGKEEELVIIENINVGETYPIKELIGEQHFTKPKARYTDASLVKALEKYGVGRPSTYASIISTVVDRGYVEKEGKTLIPLDVGRVVYFFLRDNFGRFVDYDYTAGVEDELDMISLGEMKYANFIDKEYQPLLKEIKKADKNVEKGDVVILGESDEKCDDCGAAMVVRLGRYGTFLSCTKFPDCKGMKGIEGGEEKLDMEKYHRPEKCPKCEKKLELKSGRYGQFWACVDYPECKGTVHLLLNEKCPECDHHLVERKSRWGQIFIGCSGYPDCKYIKKTPKKKKNEDDDEAEK